MERLSLKRYENLTQIKGYEEIAEVEQLQMKGGLGQPWVPIGLELINLICNLIKGGGSSNTANYGDETNNTLHQEVEKAVKNIKNSSGSQTITINFNNGGLPSSQTVTIDSLVTSDGTRLYGVTMPVSNFNAMYGD